MTIIIKTDTLLFHKEKNTINNLTKQKMDKLKINKILIKRNYPTQIRKKKTVG